MVWLSREKTRTRPKVQEGKKNFFQFFITRSVCFACVGHGKSMTQYCRKCGMDVARGLRGVLLHFSLFFVVRIFFPWSRLQDLTFVSFLFFFSSSFAIYFLPTFFYFHFISPFNSLLVHIFLYFLSLFPSFLFLLSKP